MSHWLFVILTIAGFESASAATLAAPQGGGLPTVSISSSAGPANELGEVMGFSRYREPEAISAAV